MVLIHLDRGSGIRHKRLQSGDDRLGELQDLVAPLGTAGKAYSRSAQLTVTGHKWSLAYQADRNTF